MEVVGITFSVSSGFRQACEKEKEVKGDYSWQDQFHSFSPPKSLCAWKLKCVCMCMSVCVSEYYSRWKRQRRSQKVNLTSYYTLFFHRLQSHNAISRIHTQLHSHTEDRGLKPGNKVLGRQRRRSKKILLLSDIFTLFRRAH